MECMQIVRSYVFGLRCSSAYNINPIQRFLLQDNPGARIDIANEGDV